MLIAFYGYYAVHSIISKTVFKETVREASRDSFIYKFDKLLSAMSSLDICTTNEISITNESQINEPKLKKSENIRLYFFYWKFWALVIEFHGMAELKT